MSEKKRRKKNDRKLFYSQGKCNNNGAERRRDALLYDCATERLVGMLERRHRAVVQMVLVVVLVERAVADGAAEDAADWAPAG